MSRGPMMHLNRTPKVKIGDAWHGWTVTRLLIDGPRAMDRQWEITCGCGYRNRKYENELNKHVTTCITCGHAARRARQCQSED